MNCPFCHATDTKVVDSRLVAEDNQVRRRRECVICSERFTTYEVVELAMPRVIKRDGSRALFDLSKLQNSLLRALEKRPVAATAIEQTIHRVLQRIRACGEREISSKLIGEYVMEELCKLDHVAYVRFASVYRNFQGVDEFREEIKRLKEQLSTDQLQQQESPL